MFTFESIVDTVQGAQTKFIETFVADKKVQAEMLKLVDGNANFAKTAYKTTITAAETTVKQFSDSVKSVTTKKSGA